jgi:hypothetical protein
MTFDSSFNKFHTMKNLFSLLCFFSFLGFYGQEVIVKDNSSRSSSSNYSNKVTYYKVNEGDVIILNDDTIGTPYLFDEFQLGSIFVYDEETVNNIAVKYNAYNDVFFIKPSLNSSNTEAQGITKSIDLKIKLGDKFFVALPSMDIRGNLQYYEVLSSGKKGKLLKKNSKLYKERIEATTSLTRDVPATFKDQTTYFFQHKNGDFSELPTSKKKFIAVFDGEKKQVTAIIKEHKLNIKNELDLIKFFKLYESI